MRLVFGLLALTAACGDDGNQFPVGGGGTDGGGLIDSGPRPDARVDAPGTGTDAAPMPIDAAIFTGRVCLAEDPRKLNVCSDTLAGGLTVRLLPGSATTTTNAKGEFMIAGSANATTWSVTGTNIVTSHMLLGDYEIPAITRADYTAMIAANMNGLVLNPGEGSIMVQTIQNGAGLAGAFGESVPTAPWTPFTDNPASETDWNQTVTDDDGTLWFAGLDVGTASVTITGNGGDITRGGLPIYDGGITFTTVIFP